jgi:hypothetical protein
VRINIYLSPWAKPALPDWTIFQLEPPKKRLQVGKRTMVTGAASQRQALEVMPF